MTNFTMPNNFCYMKYALKYVPDLADVGVLNGDGDGQFLVSQMLGLPMGLGMAPKPHPDVWRGQEKVSND